MTTDATDALVIGGSGLLGQALLQVLQREGWSAQGAAQSSLPGMFPLEREDPEAGARLIQRLSPRVVFLADRLMDGAAAAATHPSDDGPSLPRLLEAGRRSGARVVLYSSDMVFDGSGGPYAEEDVPAPTSVGGKALYEAEQALRSLLPETSLILRTSMPFGWGRGSRNLAMQVWESLQAGDSLRVASDQWGNPTYVEYLAEASVRLVQMDIGGIVHVAGRDRMVAADLARSLAKSMALNPDLIVPAPAREVSGEDGGPLNSGLKMVRLEQLLRTEPMTLSEFLSRFRRQWRADTHVTYAAQTLSDEASKLKNEIFEKVRRYYAVAHQPRTFVPFKSRVNYAGRVFGAEEIVNLVDSALDFWLTLGPYGERFEQHMKRFFGARDFLSVNSGSTANLLAVMTMMSSQLKRPLRPGDEVITAAVGFPTTLAPIVHGGLIPVFVDAEVGTYNINPSLIEAAVSKNTRAIMIAHTLGNPCDMDVIVDVAKRHDLYLIEDCCDALGGTFQGRLVGTFGDLATLSFYPAHQITMGEGGGVVVNRPWLSRTARSIRDWGRDCWCAPGESNTCGKRFGWQLGELPRGYDHKYTYSNLGYNFKPTDMQAAIGVAQADRLDQFVSERRRNFERLYEGLAPYQDALVLPTRDPRADPSWFGFPITVKQEGLRGRLVQWLENSNIETREVFGGNLLRQPAFQHINARIHGSLHESDRIMRDTFFIGVYPGLTEDMVDFMLDVFRSYFKQSPAGSARP